MSLSGKKVNYIDIVAMEDSPEKFKLALENGFKSIRPKVKLNSHAQWNSKFSGEKSFTKKIKGDPESIGKSEAEIEDEILAYCRIKKIMYFETKVKGEVQSVGKGRAILKKATNPGFPDFIIGYRGYIFGFETKKCGGTQSHDQILMEERFQLMGWAYNIVTSLSEFKKAFYLELASRNVSLGFHLV